MSVSSLFSAAVFPWLRNLDDKGAREVYKKINQSLQDADLEVVARPNNVPDAYGELTVASAEPLTCWDEREPAEIFHRGFQPLLTPQSLDEFRKLSDNQINFLHYVYDNAPSIYATATRYVLKNGNLERWSPVTMCECRCECTCTRRRYEYEIFAYGGIDVELSLRPKHNKYPYKQEVVFPGGIRSGLIRSAREYNADGKIIRVWQNLKFNPLLNGDHTPRVDLIPPLRNVVDRSNFFVIDSPDDEGIAQNYGRKPDDLKKYKLVADPWMAKDVPVFHIGRACLIIDPLPDAYRAYFFSGTRVMTMHLTRDYNIRDSVGTGGVQNIIDAFPALRQAKFTHVDAAMRSVNYPDDAYFFCGDMYVRTNIKGDRLISGPSKITQNWATFREAGFTQIDAILQDHNYIEEAYVFRGAEYIRIRITKGTNDEDVLIGEPASITYYWQSIGQSGFDSIDALVPNPHREGNVYFFKGDQYFSCEYTLGHRGDTINVGPRSIAYWWVSLEQAKFY